MEYPTPEKRLKTTANATAGASTSAANDNIGARLFGNQEALAQFNADAGLLTEFEQSLDGGKSFNYAESVRNKKQYCPDDEVNAYLSKIQRGGLIQPHGCLLAIEAGTFKIICYSENCFEVLGLGHTSDPSQSPSLIGVDFRILFIPDSGKTLENAVQSRQFMMLNPIWVYSSSQKPFYAILHALDEGIIIDLEPADANHPLSSVTGMIPSQKLAVQAISNLQSLPGGDIRLLCDTVAKEVQKLTGFDRVMVYKFHQDQHGQVISEVKRPDLEPYLDLHYPATDIPQAARFLFKQSRVRMICDCLANPVRLIQSKELNQPLPLLNSTLRAPHRCHASYMGNMGSIASLVLAIIVNRNGREDLWGLVACHHESFRYIPYPVRYACGFLMQVLAIQLNMEIQLAEQVQEKKILRMQTLLCDLLLRDVPFGVVTQSPTIVDLVKCNGAALFYQGKCFLLGVTPSESQVKDISEWLLKNYRDSTGLSTDSLIDMGYPGAASLADEVCGMAAARISERDFLFWFRSHTAKEIQWGAAVHNPEDRDDDGKMHPRTSFQSFLEVVKSRSLPWEISEMNAIQSLQVRMRDTLLGIESSAAQRKEYDVQKKEGDVFSFLASEMDKLLETASAPIFGVDSDGIINGWNRKISELMGLSESGALGKSLLDDIISADSLELAKDVLSKALLGEEKLDVELKMKIFNAERGNSDLYILTSACPSRDSSNNVVGVCFVGQDITSDKVVRDRFIRMKGDYETIVHGFNPLIPPIFASTENAICFEWNTSMEKLTGVSRSEVIGKFLPGHIFGVFCKLKDQDMLTKFTSFLYRVIDGQDCENFPFEFFDRGGKRVEVSLMASKRTDESGKIIGCIFFLQTISCMSESSSIRQEIRRSLNGIRFIHQLLENTISAEHRQFLDTSDACQRQMISVLEDIDLKCIEKGRIELKSEEFLFVHVIDAIVSQIMIALNQRQVQLILEIHGEIKALSVIGDQVRLQLVLSDFLENIACNTPSHSWVQLMISPASTIIDRDNLFQIQLRMCHPGHGLPHSLVQDMFEEGNNRWSTDEGLSLNTSRKLLELMNGSVNYVREIEKCYFLVDLKLRISGQGGLAQIEGSNA